MDTRAVSNASWFELLADSQLDRIERFTDRILTHVKQRRAQRLSETYTRMDAETKIAHRAGGKRKPAMDARYEWPE